MKVHFDIRLKVWALYGIALPWWLAKRLNKIVRTKRGALINNTRTHELIWQLLVHVKHPLLRQNPGPTKRLEWVSGHWGRIRKEFFTI